MPERVWRRRMEGWRKPPGSLMVTRPHRWSNPFRAGGLAVVFEIEDGLVTAMPYEGPLPAGEYNGFKVREVRDNADAVELFRGYIAVIDMAFPGLIAKELGGLDLGCYCRPPAPCHVDVLLPIANP